MRALTVLLVVGMIFDYRFEGKAASISVLEIVAAAGAAAILLSMLARWNSTGHVSFERGGKIPGTMLVYLFLAASSAVVAAMTMHSVDGLQAFRDMIAGIVLATIVILRGGGSAARNDVYWSVAVGVAVAGALALTQYAFGWPYLHRLHEHAYFKYAVGGTELVRHPVVGSVAHPNAFAVLIGPLVVMSTGHAAGWKGSRRGKVVLWSLVAVALAGMIATQAKMAVLVFTVAAIATGWLVIRRACYTTATGRWAATGALLLFAAILLGVITFGSDLPALLSPSTLIERALLNSTAIGVLTESPLRLAFGGCVQAVLALTPTGLGVHNEYISQCVKFGVPTALLFCACMFSALALPAATGWKLAPALIATCVVFVVEGAAGVQHQAMVFLIWACAVASRERRAEAGEA
jgi:hypothetical protein